MARIANLSPVIRAWISPIFIIVLWESAARLHLVPPFLLPSCSATVMRLGKDIVSQGLLGSVAISVARALIGFFLASLIGVAIGLLMARLAAARWFFGPIVSLALPTPKIAFLPIFVLWFGVTDASSILMVTFSCMFPIIVNVVAGVEGVDQIYRWSALSLGASRSVLIHEIDLPAAIPQILTGLQIALPLSLIVELVSEMAMGSSGMGGDILTEMRFLDTTGVFSGLMAAGIAGATLMVVMEHIRRHVLVWHLEEGRK